jgi:hypothetical protein
MAGLPRRAGGGAPGVLVFSSHGPDVDRWLQTGERHYGLDRSAIDTIVADYAREGFGYADYPDTVGYGIAVIEPEVARQLIERAGLRVVDYTPTGWDSHQDVYTCVRR